MIAPLRDTIWTREEEIAYALERGHPGHAHDRRRRTRSTRTCSAARSRPGVLEDPWVRAAGGVYALTSAPDAGARPGRDRDRLRGRPAGLDRRRGAAARRARSAKLNGLAGAYGIGRIDMIENRAVGIKSREVYEAPAAIALIDGAPRARGRRPDEGRGRGSSTGSRSAGRSSSTRACGSRPVRAGDRRIRRRDAGARHGRGAASSCGRTRPSSTGRRSRARALRRAARVVRGRARPSRTRRPRASSRSQSLESELVAARARPARPRPPGMTRLVRDGSSDGLDPAVDRVPPRRRRRAAPVRLRGDGRARRRGSRRPGSAHGRRARGGSRRRSPAPRVPMLPEDEDVHSAIERKLGESAARSTRAGSRNDQVAAAFRLYVADACAEAREAIDALRGACSLDRAARRTRDADARLHAPAAGAAGHARPPPARLGRDARARPRPLRLRGRAAGASPLGAGALAGRRSPLPPPATRCANSLDAVADRDFALDYLYAAAVLLHPPVADRRGDRALVDDASSASSGCRRRPRPGRR